MGVEYVYYARVKRFVVCLCEGVTDGVVGDRSAGGKSSFEGSHVLDASGGYVGGGWVW